MDKHIKIYKWNNKYCFTVNKFSSIRHSGLTKHASSNYRYAWEAYRDARTIAKKHAYHIDALEKFALEDFNTPIVDEVAAESLLADHYEVIYDGLCDVADGMEDDDKAQKKVNYLEAKAVISEILFVIEKVPEDEMADEDEQDKGIIRLEDINKRIAKLVHKYYKDELAQDVIDDKEKQNALPEGGMEDPMGDPMAGMGDPMGGMAPPMGGGMAPPMGGGMAPPMASSKSFIKTAQATEDDSLDQETIDELMDEYACLACSAIEGRHADAVYKIGSNSVSIVGKDGPILDISIGDDLFITDITPTASTSEMYPYQSLEFYQAYWKPIVEKIGHCCVGDSSKVLFLENSSLPDIPKEFPFESHSLRAIGKVDKEVKPMVVSFRGNKPSWFIQPCSLEKTAQVSDYTEQEYYQNGKGAMVICNDQTLTSYYKQTGNVIQVVPFDDHVEIDIDFGHHVCRMTEDQFEIIDGL